MLALHRWAFFVPFCVVTCTAFILSLYYPRTYRATTSFTRRNDPVMLNLPMSAAAATFRYFRLTMIRDLTSFKVMSEVVDKLGMTKDFERNEDGTFTKSSTRRRNSLARSLGNQINIQSRSPNEHIDHIKIIYTGPDPEIGRELVEQVKQTYVKQTMAWIHDFLTSQYDYFAEEAEKALEVVNEVQRVETRLRLQHPYVDPTDPGAISTKLAQLEIERRGMLLRKREYEVEHAAQQQLMAAIEPALVIEEITSSNQGDAISRVTPLSQEAVYLADQVGLIDEKIQELRTTRGMTDFHPDIRELHQNRTRLRGELEQQRSFDRQNSMTNTPLRAVTRDVAHRSSPINRTWQSDRARLLVQTTTQKAKLKDLEFSLSTNEEMIKQLRQAKKDIYVNQEEFAEASERTRQAERIHEDLLGTLSDIDPAIKAVAQNRLLQFSDGTPARGGGIAISPRSKTVVILALLAGLASGIIFVILAEVFDHVYRSSAQVARSLGLPTLETIDEIITSQDRRYLFVRRVVVTPLVVLCFVGLTGLTGALAYLSIEKPWTYQKLRRIPQAAIELFAGDLQNDLDDETAHDS